LLSGEYYLSESKKEWEETYKNIPKDQTLKMNIKSPENFIDDIKLNYLRKYLPTSGVVVEIGAGSGRFLTKIALENKNLSIVGIDFESVNMIQDNVNKFNLNGISIKADAYNIPIKSNSVDAVISGGFLEHFNNKELGYIISEMKRILKPNGLFYAEIVPNKKSLCRPVIFTEMGGYESKLDRWSWEFILKCDGFKNIKVVSGLVIPPNFYMWFRRGFLLDLTYKFKYYIEYMDNTLISDILGFSYYITAEK
jgi:ubiquinone/menaquinone biosynthesis C-methylase UbiE